MEIELEYDLSYNDKLKITVESSEIASYEESLCDGFNGLKKITTITLKSGKTITANREAYSKIKEIKNN